VYRIRIVDAATRELARLDKPLARRIIERITWLATNLDTISPEALTGELAGFYKLRVGDYRVIYEILYTEQTLVIHAIGYRREIYRRR
jgi:mRNA interferase RelE/StbE